MIAGQGLAIALPQVQQGIDAAGDAELIDAPKEKTVDLVGTTRVAATAI